MYTYAQQSSTAQPADHPDLDVATTLDEAESTRRDRTLVAILFLAAGIVAALSVTANGQDAAYDTIEIHQAFNDPLTMRRVDTAVKDLAQKKDLSTVRDPNYAKGFYLSYLPGKLTQPSGLAEIPKLTQELTKNLTTAQRSGNPGARQMVEWLYAGMKKVAEGNYHPAGRITALSILGRLDARAASTTDKSPPVPYTPVFPVLLAEYEKESNPDGVRAAALQGLQRFVSIGFPSLSDQQKAQVTTAMQKLLDEDVPAGRDRLAHAYLQRFAVDILSVLEPDQGGKLAERLVNISVQPERHDLIALYSVSKLANARELGAVAENPEPVLDHWTVRAMRAFQYEHERLSLLDGIGSATKQPVAPEKTVSKKADPKTFVPGNYDDDGGGDDGGGDDYGDDGGGGDSMDDYGDGGDGGDDGGYFVGAAKTQPIEVLASRSRLNHVLQQIHRGVTGSAKAGKPSKPGGLLAVVKDDKKKKLEKWVKDMESLVLSLNDPLNDDRTKFKKALLTQIETIKVIAGPAGEEAAAQDAKLPMGLNPYAKLAVFSGEPLEKAKEVASEEAPEEKPAGESVDAAKPPVDAAASKPIPAAAGT